MSHANSSNTHHCDIIRLDYAAYQELLGEAAVPIDLCLVNMHYTRQILHPSPIFGPNSGFEFGKLLKDFSCNSIGTLNQACQF